MLATAARLTASSLVCRPRVRGAARGVFSMAESEVPSGSILEGLDGQLLDTSRLSEALQSTVTSLKVVPGSERRWPQSHSAELELHVKAEDQTCSVRRLFLKKVIARNLPAKSLLSLRRDLLSNRIETRFYREFAPELSARGLPLLDAPLIEEHLQGLDDDVEADAEAEAEKLRKGGILLLLQCADSERYLQTSPLSEQQARSSLQVLARLHAAAWEDVELLTRASRRLHGQACYWELSKRGDAELKQLQPNWHAYCDAFASCSELLRQPEIRRLGERLDAVSQRLAKQLWAQPESRFATLVHGDYKAMNVFLPRQVSESAMPIDFQWTGVGFGMADVAMHLSHSVDSGALKGVGEVELLKFYHQQLLHCLRQQGKDLDNTYSFEVALEHYEIALLDYARMVISCFFKDASPEVFQSKSGMPNVGLIYRNVEASLAFVERVDRYLLRFEGSLEKSKQLPSHSRSRSPRLRHTDVSIA